MNVVPLNSFNLYEFECDDELTNRVLEDIKNTKLFWKSTGKPLSPFYKDDHIEVNDVSSYAYLDDKLNFPYYHKDFFSWLQQCLDEVANVYFKNIKLTISDAWPVKTSFGQGISSHLHSKSIFSGVFYFDSFSSSGTRFHQKNLTVEHIRSTLGLRDTNDFDDFRCASTYTFTSLPKKNKLVIFPSNLPHSMEKHKLIKTRYTFSFNSYFDGIVCDDGTGKLELRTVSVKEKNQRFLKSNSPYE